MTPLRLNKAHFPVTVLGPGRRIGIWFQGCSIGCVGCVSQDTWDATGSTNTTVEAVLGWCMKTQAEHGMGGVTVSGGEPFEQPLALLELLSGLTLWRAAQDLNFDIICYSGLPLKRLKRDHKDILELLDILIPEPYVDKSKNAPLWRGSSNQPLTPLSKRGNEIVNSVPEDSAQKRFQLSVTNGQIWFVGMPDRGDMQRLETLAVQRGLTLSGASWRQDTNVIPNKRNDA